VTQSRMMLIHSIYTSTSAMNPVLMKEMTNDGKYNYDTAISVSHFDMISIHESFSSHANTVPFLGARDLVKSALVEEKVIFPQFETLGDISMLIAGTEDQPLHHDIARAYSQWVSKINYNAKEEHPVQGWEVGRREYNKAMCSPYAPSSIILGMGEGAKLSLGVQKDQISQVGEKKCMVIGGTGETFDIVRETKYLAVIRTEHGFMFTGDFRHAGVRNVSRQSPDNRLLELLNDKVTHTLGDESLSSQKQLTKIVDMLCNFPNLNKLCRFHCTTQLLDDKMKPLLNTVGFTGCLPNPPRSKGERGPDKKKRKTRSCQFCHKEKCPGHVNGKPSVSCVVQDVGKVREVLT
jgi:hypothetical protein